MSYRLLYHAATYSHIMRPERNLRHLQGRQPAMLNTARTSKKSLGDRVRFLMTGVQCLLRLLVNQFELHAAGGGGGWGTGDVSRLDRY